MRNDDFATALLGHLSSGGHLGRAERHILSLKAAKYVRPTFMFACGEVLDVPRQKLMDAACAVELIHTATLIHDDIIDEADERRGVSSVNAKFGNKMAVLAGDGLLAHALLLLSSGGRPMDTVKRASETVITMAEAVALEFETPDGAARDAEELLRIVDGKTGALFSLAGFLTGVAVNDDNAGEQLGRIGMLVGRVFQIKDDIDDLEEDRNNNTPTIPSVLGGEAAESHIADAQAELDTIMKGFEAHPKYSELQMTIRQITRS